MKVTVSIAHFRLIHGAANKDPLALCGDNGALLRRHQHCRVCVAHDVPSDKGLHQPHAGADVSRANPVPVAHTVPKEQPDAKQGRRKRHIPVRAFPAGSHRQGIVPCVERQDNVADLQAIREDPRSE